MTTRLIASTRESTGKTSIALALAQIAQANGKQVGYMKPKGTRLQSNVGKTLDADPMLARELLDLDAEMHDMEPIVYSPTFVESAIRGREQTDELTDRVRNAFESLSDDTDLMVVEGADAVTTGGVVDLTDADIADILDAKVTLIATYDESRDLDELLAAVDHLGDRCDSIVFNGVADAVFDDVDGDVAAFLERRDLPVRGVIPRNRELAGVSVWELADELGASMLVEPDEDGDNGRIILERFLVGAMSGDTALNHFRRTKDAAVITGGDRADLQTAALDAPGVKALVLTGGYEPSGAILGRAAERGVPVLLVDTDTLTAVERAEAVVRSGRVRDEETVEIMRTLLSEHADVDTLLD